MIEDIRKKSKHCSLSFAEVDTLFAEIAQLKEKSEAQHKDYERMHSRFKETTKELDEYRILCQGHVLAQKQWKEELAEARGKEKAALFFARKFGKERDEVREKVSLIEGAIAKFDTGEVSGFNTTLKIKQILSGKGGGE